jgi:hypothetical protein
VNVWPVGRVEHSAEALELNTIAIVEACYDGRILEDVLQTDDRLLVATYDGVHVSFWILSAKLSACIRRRRTRGNVLPSLHPLERMDSIDRDRPTKYFCLPELFDPVVGYVFKTPREEDQFAPLFAIIHLPGLASGSCHVLRCDHAQNDPLGLVMDDVVWTAHTCVRLNLGASSNRTFRNRHSQSR